jgi:hypothetical protein
MRQDPNRTWEDKSYGEMLVVEGFTLWQVPGITMRSAEITGILAPLIAISVVMQQILSLLGAQQVIGDFVTSMGGYHACCSRRWSSSSSQAWYLNRCR